MTRHVQLPPRPRTEPLTEKQWQEQVLDIARLGQWHCYHAWLSIHSEHGWPDLNLVRPPRIVFAELKDEKGKLTDKQRRWLALLGDCPGVEVYCWRPSDMDQVVRVLTGRETVLTGRETARWVD